MNNKLTFRTAERKDTALILQFIKELADYEKMLDEVVADEATLETWIFDKQKAGSHLESYACERISESGSVRNG